MVNMSQTARVVTRYKYMSQTVYDCKQYVSQTAQVRPHMTIQKAETMQYCISSQNEIVTKMQSSP